MFKKFCALALAGTMIMGLSTTSFAAEPINNEHFEIVAVENLTDGVTRASWGTGSLYCSDPLFSNPQGYAKTSTYAGTAYKIAASISVKDSNNDTYSSETTTNTNSESAESATITSKTKKCTFTGNHKVKDTSSSGWQYATTSKTY